MYVRLWGESLGSYCGFSVEQGCQTHFHWGYISLVVAFKGLNVILGLYKCNYFLTVKQEVSAAAG